jgi:hypothetical protein
MCVLSRRFGEKAALRGSGRGPWTVQVILSADLLGIKRFDDDVVSGGIS